MGHALARLGFSTAAILLTAAMLAQSPASYRLVHVAGLVNNGAGRLAVQAGVVRPRALTGDEEGNVYIAFENRVYMAEASSGLYEHIAGDGGVRTGGDGGPATEASFGPIRALAYWQGGLYIAQAAPCFIRRVDLATGLLATVAGSGACPAPGETASFDGPVETTPVDAAALAFDRDGTLTFASARHWLGRINFASGQVTRIAGTGQAGGAGDGGPALDAELDSPAGLAIDSAGALYVAEAAGHAIRRIDPARGTIQTIAGTRRPGAAGDGGPAILAELDTPRALALDAAGSRLYFGQGRRLRAIDLAAGTIERLPVQFRDVGLGLWADPEGGVVVSDTGAQAVVRVKPDGSLEPVAGRGRRDQDGPARFATLTPRDVHVTPEGRLLISDGPLNRKVRELEGGVVHTVAEATAGRLASDGHGYVYVMDGVRQSVMRIGPSGALEKIAEPSGMAAGIAVESASARVHLSDTAPGLAIDADGNLYSADHANKQVRKVTPAGEEVTLAGSGLEAYKTPANGDAHEVGIGAPVDVAVDGAGNVYILGASADGVSGVWRFEKGRDRLDLIAGGPDAEVPLTRLWGLDVDERGVVYLADEENGRILGLVPATLDGPYVTGAIAPGAFGAGDELAAGGWLEVYGFNLSPRTADWSEAFVGSRAPKELAGVRVLVNGAPAALSLVSPGQVNAQAPEGVIAGSARIEVVTPKGTSNAVAMPSNPRAGWMLAPPALHDGYVQFVLAVLPDGALAAPPGLLEGVRTRPARPGEVVVMYGVGFGAVSPAVTPGEIAGAAAALPAPRVLAGGRDARLLYAGLVPGAVGLYQFNAEAPAGLHGAVRLEVMAGGETTGQPIWLSVE